jgi:hypothetical protein
MSSARPIKRSAPPPPPPANASSATGSPRKFTAAQPSCTASTLQAVVATDKASYAKGEPVAFKGVILNGGSQACAIGLADQITVVDATGTAFYEGSFPTGVTEQVEPGESRPTTFTWQQQSCRKPGCLEHAQGGRYSVTFRWAAAESVITAATTFSIT